MPVTYTISEFSTHDLVEKVNNNKSSLLGTDAESPYKVTVTDDASVTASFRVNYITISPTLSYVICRDLNGEIHFFNVKISESNLVLYFNKPENSNVDGPGFLSYFQNNEIFPLPESLFNALIPVQRQEKEGVLVFEPSNFVYKKSPLLSLLSLPTFSARFYQSTFGDHAYRTVAGIVLLVSLWFLLFLSPASFLLLPFLGKTLSLMAFGLQNIFVTILAKIMVATVGGFLVLTAPKWIGNLCQFIGIRLLGGIVGRIIILSMFLLMCGIIMTGFIVGTIPVLLLEQCSKKAANFCGNFLVDFAVLFSFFLLAPPLAIVCSVGAIINVIGIVISGEYQHIQEKPSSNNNTPGAENKSNSSVWNKISLALFGNPIPAAETLKHDPAIADPINRLIWAEKYDRFCDFFRSKNAFFGNLCYTNERKKFISMCWEKSIKNSGCRNQPPSTPS